MTEIPNVSKKTSWVWAILIVGFVLFSLSPSVYELSRRGDLHPNRQFELIHNFPTDYNFYLSRIREGLEGRWTVYEKYTSELHSGSFIHALYLLMGKAGAWVRVPWGRAGDIYHMARTVLAVVLLIAIAEFCAKSIATGKGGAGVGIPEKQSNRLYTRTNIRLLAFLLAITASSWPKLVAVVNGSIVPATIENVFAWRFGGYMAWWSVMDSLQRITFIPHILAGQALIVVLIYFVTHKTLLHIPVTVIGVGLLAFVLGMIFPPGLIFVYAVMGIWMVLSGKKITYWFVPYGAIVAISMPSLLYLALMTSMYPWKRLVEVDIIRPLPFDYMEYAKSLGPMLPLGIIGLIVALWTWEVTIFPAVAWVLAWGALLGLFAFVPQQSPLRFSEMVPHVPLGVLTAYLLYYVGRVRYMKKMSAVCAVVLVSLGLFHMYSSYLWQKDFVDHKIRATLPLVPTGSYVMYPLKDFILAMKYLEEVTRGEGVVLSETTAANYLPVYSGNTVYAGHDNTVAFEGKKERVKEFFSGAMDKYQVKSWVADTRASYVFYGPQEREDGGGADLSFSYPFLHEVYKNPMVRIYRIVFN